MTEQPAILWQPSPEGLEQTNLSDYVAWLRRERGLDFRVDDYESLQRWSASAIEEFWGSIWEYFDVDADGDASVVLADRTMPGAKWFPNSSLNFAEHIFRDKTDDSLALVEQSELRSRREITWRELRERSAAIASGLTALGVVPGDRVAAYLQNGSEAIAGFLAAASIGAIW